MAEKRKSDLALVEPEPATSDNEARALMSLVSIAEKWVASQPETVKTQAEAQVRIAEEAGKTKRTSVIMTAVIGGVAVISLSTVIVVAIATGKDELAKQVLMIALPTVAAALGGYGLGKRKSRDDAA